MAHIIIIIILSGHTHRHTHTHTHTHVHTLMLHTYTIVVQIWRAYFRVCPLKCVTALIGYFPRFVDSVSPLPHHSSPHKVHAVTCCSCHGKITIMMPHISDTITSPRQHSIPLDYCRYRFNVCVFFYRKANYNPVVCVTAWYTASQVS